MSDRERILIHQWHGNRTARSNGELVYLADAMRLCRWYRAEYGCELDTGSLTADVIERFRMHCQARFTQRTWMRKRSALRWLIRELAPLGVGVDADLAEMVRAS